MELIQVYKAQLFLALEMRTTSNEGCFERYKIVGYVLDGPVVRRTAVCTTYLELECGFVT